MNCVDLRSDTVTQPTAAMRQAMANAPVGDDVYGEDPTINRLEALAAAKVGKEAGLFIASGTMGNLVALLTHCGRGDEVILGSRSHTFLFEGGGVSALGSIHPAQLPNQPDGTIDLDEMERAIRDPDDHHPITRLICLENTHNRCGGVALSAAYTRAVGELAHRHGLQLHLDGARLFNAAAALGVPAAELAAPVDSVTFCLSKGLCAPVGSVLCGSEAFIRKARRLRKQVGGGMRQAGILAAAGIVALEEMTERLTEDHRRARQLAEALAGLPGVQIDPGSPHTNMVFLALDPARVRLSDAELEAQLATRGVLIHPVAPRHLRLVTHYWIDEAAVAQAVQAFAAALN